MWKDVVVAYFKVIFHNFPEEAEENHENFMSESPASEQGKGQISWNAHIYTENFGGRIRCDEGLRYDAIRHLLQ
jgi:hypothetical protein